MQSLVSKLTGPKFIDEIGDKDASQEYPQDSRAFLRGSKHYQSMSSELMLFVPEPHNIMVQTPKGLYIVLPTAEAFLPY